MCEKARKSGWHRCSVKAQCSVAKKAQTQAHAHVQ